jgi:hypothetical protein
VIYNLASDVHLTLPVEVNGKPQRAPLHKIPHYQFGRLVGFDDFVLYIFFPRLYDPDSSGNTYLSQATLQRWVDDVLLYSLYSQAEGGTTQHYPANYAHSKLSSHAKYAETHSRINNSTQHLAITQYIPPQNVQEVWDLITERVKLPGLEDFDDHHLFITAKNLKVLTKRPTLAQMWEFFVEKWGQSVDLRYMSPDLLWLDLGKEVCAPYSFMIGQPQDQITALTYLWRPCCLDSYWRWSLRGAAPRRSLRCDYQTALLRDAVGMTVLSPARSADRAQGLLYSQFYNSQKEIFDAAKTYPFHDPALETLALDPKLVKAWQHTGRSQNHQLETLLTNYYSSRERSHMGLTFSEQKSFGTREEHRMTFILAEKVFQRVRAQGQWNSGINVADHIRPYWCVRTDDYLQFIQFNMNKFLAGFEYIWSQSSRDPVSWEHSKMMIMCLRLVKFSYGSHQLKAESALWWDRRELGNGAVREGLGLSQTLERYGYGWSLDKFEWKNFLFQSNVTNLTLFGNVKMGEAYRARWREVKGLKDDFLLIEQVLSMWEEHRHLPQNLAQLVSFLNYVLVRHFRKDVFAALKKDIRPEYLERALQGDIELCADRLSQVLNPTCRTSRGRGRGQRQAIPNDLHFVHGNHLRFKDTADFVDFLWYFGDEETRTHWDNKGYRALYQRCCVAIKDISGAGASNTFRLHFRRFFLLTNWVLPYPSSEVFMQRTQDGDRRWISVYCPEVNDISQRQNRKVSWKDLPAQIPATDWILATRLTKPKVPNSVLLLKGIPTDQELRSRKTIEHLDRGMVLGKEIYERRRGGGATRAELAAGSSATAQRGS